MSSAVWLKLRELAADTSDRLTGAPDPSERMRIARNLARDCRHEVEGLTGEEAVAVRSVFAVVEAACREAPRAG